MGLLDYIFNDKRGKRVIVQPPNFTIVCFFILLAAQSVVGHGRTHRILAALAFGTIFYWSLQEILRGDSRFRKLLGLSVLVLAVLAQA